MPHTIKTLLELFEHGTYIDGTFVLAKDHIILGGPTDLHNDENNERLVQRLVDEGYDGGALLLNEYSDEYPHVEGTIGFIAGQSSGPMFYINLNDNSEAHSALKDPCFGKVVRGFDLLRRVAGMPKGEDGVFQSPIYIVGTKILDQ
jgi:cyclophilin family peptidyl-prolyl cis-trans isomerase